MQRWQGPRETSHAPALGIHLCPIGQYFLAFNCILQFCSHVHAKANEEVWMHSVCNRGESSLNAHQRGAGQAGPGRIQQSNGINTTAPRQ